MLKYVKVFYMNNESLIEKIGAIKNEMSHIWGGIFVIGGGSITLMFGEVNPLKMFFIVVGIFLTTLFINAYAIRRQELMNYLKKIEEGR